MQKQPDWNFNNSYAKLPKHFFTKQAPTPVKMPKLVIFNNRLADFLGVPLQPEVFAGNIVPKGADPLAQAYAGHQFGHFTMLGDGRAILIGEHITDLGKRFDVQLKGTGQTPYSRGGDGRAALAPMLREYLISEAMHTLNIPTTRSLAVVQTGEMVKRERDLPGAILTRIAASHIRVGTFEYAAHFGTVKNIRRLADYTIARHFLEIKAHEDKYLFLLKEVIKKQAYLIAKWQLVGFVHGVMNTDNMAISGETIDYGPCAFMDIYNPDTVFSSIDTSGRYAYSNQPKIAVWNLTRFAETILPLIDENEERAVDLAQGELAKFADLYQGYWFEGMKLKLGLHNENAEDEPLIKDLLQLMQQYKADYTNTFRTLTLDKDLDKKADAMFFKHDFILWHERWQKRLGKQPTPKSELKKLMEGHNPYIIPKNYYVEEALSAAENGELTLLNKMLTALSDPYEYTTDKDEYLRLPESASGCCYKTFCGT